jgi:chaperonin GroEL
MGFRIVRRACEEPLRKIASNAGCEGGEIVAEFRRRKLGWNAATGRWGDLMQQGVLDPTRVTRTALQSAGSIAGLLLITESLVVDDLEAMKKVKDALPQGGPGMTGMGY